MNASAGDGLRSLLSSYFGSYYRVTISFSPPSLLLDVLAHHTHTPGSAFSSISFFGAFFSSSLHFSGEPIE